MHRETEAVANARDYFGQCPNTQVSGKRFGHFPHAAAMAPLVTNSESQQALRRT